jgi:hypothetical protein
MSSRFFYVIYHERTGDRAEADTREEAQAAARQLRKDARETGEGGTAVIVRLREEEQE